MTIKETSGKVLMYFYALYRNNPAYATTVSLSFDFDYDPESVGNQPKLSGDLIVVECLHQINGSNTDLYTVMSYLTNSGFILSKERSLFGGRHTFTDVRPSSVGIDIIEGIERGQEEKKEFNVVFNIKVENNMNVESLLKANISGLFSLGGVNI